MVDPYTGYGVIGSGIQGLRRVLGEAIWRSVSRELGPGQGHRRQRASVWGDSHQGTGYPYRKGLSTTGRSYPLQEGNTAWIQSEAWPMSVWLVSGQYKGLFRRGNEAGKTPVHRAYRVTVNKIPRTDTGTHQMFVSYQARSEPDASRSHYYMEKGVLALPPLVAIAGVDHEIRMHPYTTFHPYQHHHHLHLLHQHTCRAPDSAIPPHRLCHASYVPPAVSSGPVICLCAPLLLSLPL